MDCEQNKTLIDAYIDNELDIINSVEVERHLANCENCSLEYRNYLALHSMLKDESIYFQAPSELMSKIEVSFSTPEKKQFNYKQGVFRWQAAAGGFALTVIALILFIVLRAPQSTESQLTEQIVDNHMRSLMPNHLYDVQSTDQHTVKPWFNGKLDFSPPVTDLSGQGFNLVGGRLDYINGLPVAAIIYQRKAHYINLFFWFSDNKEVINKKAAVTRGYNVIHWAKGNKNYWAVSDINLTELDEFAARIQETQ